MRNSDGTLQCDKSRECSNLVTHVGSKGYIYCASCAAVRRITHIERTRKLRAWELTLIKCGGMLSSYKPIPKPHANSASSMSEFISAPSRIEPSQMVTVRTVYGDALRLFRPQFESTRNTLLKIYKEDGESVNSWNDRHNVKPDHLDAFLHRGNIAEVL